MRICGYQWVSYFSTIRMFLNTGPGFRIRQTLTCNVCLNFGEQSSTKLVRFSTRRKMKLGLSKPVITAANLKICAQELVFKLSGAFVEQHRVHTFSWHFVAMRYHIYKNELMGKNPISIAVYYISRVITHSCHLSTGSLTKFVPAVNSFVIWCLVVVCDWSHRHRRLEAQHLQLVSRADERVLRNPQPTLPTAAKA